MPPRKGILLRRLYQLLPPMFSQSWLPAVLEAVGRAEVHVAALVTLCRALEAAAEALEGGRRDTEAV